MTRNRLISVASLLSVVGLAASPFGPRRNMICSSPLINEWSGKLGGAVGMTTKYGMILRGNVTPNNPQSGPQFIVRNIMQSLSSYWQSTLSAEQRASWTNLAEDTPGASDGKGLFVAANNIRLRMDSADAPIVLTAPVAPTAVFNDTPTGIAIKHDLAPTTNVLEFTFPADAAFTDSWAVTDGGAVAVWASRPQRATRLTKIKPNVFLGHLKGDTTVADRPGGLQTISLYSSVDDPPLFDGAFAAADPGDVIYVTFQATDSTGRITAKYTTRVTVEAV